MEIYAGFVEHVDVQAGKLIDELDRLGIRDNTIVIYIFGDNGASAEGQNGTISELLAQNGIPNTVEQQLAALEGSGGLDALGTPKTDSMYHAAWAWAGNTPFQSHQARRLALRRHAQPDGHLVAEGHQAGPHAAGAVPPRQRHRADYLRDRRHQAAEDGRRIQAGPDRRREPRLHVQRREGAHAQEGAVLRQQRQPRHLSGRLGCGHLRPAGAVAARRTRLGRLGFGQGQVGALPDHQGFLARPTISPAKEPQRLAQLQKTFDEQAKANKVYPLGAGIWLRLHPEDRIKTPYTSWQFDATTTRMPEFTAPGIGRESSTVTIDAEIGDNASGVLYALGGSGGGLTLYMDKGSSSTSTT